MRISNIFRKDSCLSNLKNPETELFVSFDRFDLLKGFFFYLFFNQKNQEN